MNEKRSRWNQWLLFFHRTYLSEKPPADERQHPRGLRPVIIPGNLWHPAEGKREHLGARLLPLITLPGSGEVRYFSSCFFPGFQSWDSVLWDGLQALCGHSHWQVFYRQFPQEFFYSNSLLGFASQLHLSVISWLSLPKLDWPSYSENMWSISFKNHIGKKHKTHHTPKKLLQRC